MSRVLSLFRKKANSVTNNRPFSFALVPSKVRRDWFAYAVLSSLPWVGRELYEKKESELDRMLGSLEGYVKRRVKSHHVALRVFRSDTPHPQEEVRWSVILIVIIITL